MLEDYANCIPTRNLLISLVIRSNLQLIKKKTKTKITWTLSPDINNLQWVFHTVNAVVCRMTDGPFRKFAKAAAAIFSSSVNA